MSGDLNCDHCGHPPEKHDGDLAPQCVMPRCTCLAYWPKSRGPAPALHAVATSPRPEPAGLPGGRPPTLEQLLAAGKRSEFARTVKLTEKIALLLHDLRGRLHDERESAEARRVDEERRAEAKKRIADLEAQLAEARKVLRGGATSPGTSPAIAGVELICPESGCDRTFGSQRGLSHHRTTMHPPAAAAG